MKKYNLSCKVFGTLGILYILASCAYQEEKIAIAYTPLPNTTLLLKEECRNVEVKVHDARKHRNVVSRKIGSHGEEAAEIRLSDSLQKTVDNAIKSELLRLGFQIEGGDKTIQIEIQKFYNVFAQGQITSSASSECVFDVTVVKKDGSTCYKKTITGNGANKDLWTYAGNNAKSSLEKALQHALMQLFEDYTFLKALINKEQTS